MDRDSSDILGQKTMPVAPGSKAGSWFSVGNLFFISAAIVVSYAIGLRLWQRVQLWRERSYKLATRRRHGIPDSDLRPFNVAYSEAVARSREDESKKQTKPRPVFRPQAPTEVQSDGNLRQRSAVAQRFDAGLRSTAVPVPGGFNSVPPNDLQSNGHAFTTLYSNKPSATQSLPSGSRPLSRQGGYANIEDAEGKKRSWNDELDEEHESKKTRVEGDELIDGDEDAEFDDAVPKRGSKRGIRDDEASEMKKRARKVSQEADHSMDVDEEEEDEITELKSVYRGKKRDRAEAGSTFGGDDDDSAVEHEAEDDSKARRRRRKRRTVVKRKSEATYLRDKRAQHNGDEELSEESDDTSPSKVSTQRRKSKRSSLGRHQRERSKSDVSMDESITSTRTKVREIGDEWESNGVKYKIGLNGQRLRQALVKKARQKFVMPKDSQHPDRDANLQVCIESWLTEEEYQLAKADHMLAWQDSPRRQDEMEKLSLDTSHGVQFPQSAPGKNLLWSTSTATTPTVSPASSEYGYVPEAKPRSYRDSYRHSIATTVGLPISPFGSSTSMPTVKRIASSSRALSLTSSTNNSPGLSDSTNGSQRNPHKVFSKWEKQELEAKAMMKVREANKKKEMERESKLKEERELKERLERERAAAAESARLDRERAEKERQEKERAAREKAEAERKAKEAASAAPPSVPTITVTAPSAPSSMQNIFATPAATSPKPTESAPTSTVKPSAPSFFSNPPAAATNTKPSGFSFAPTSGTPVSTPAAAAPGPPMFSFSNPGAGKQETPATTTAASGGSSLLSRLATQTTEPAKAPSQPTQPLFSFSKPDTSTVPPSSAFPSATTATSNVAATSNPTASAAGATTAPKFSFNFSKPPAGGAAPGSAAAGNTSSLSGALGAGAETKPPTVASAGPTFSFKTPTTAASGAPTTNGTSSTASGASKFGFGPTSSSSSTAAPSPFGTAKEPAKNPFGTTSTPSPFGNTTTGGAKPSPFGTTSSGFGNTGFGTTGTSGSAFANASNSTPSAFGNGGASGSGFVTNTSTSSAFGAGASTPNPFGASSTPAPAANSTAKPSAFSFAPTATPPATSSTTPTTTPAAGGSSGFSFNFGGAPATTTPKASPFGAPASSGTSLFGNAGSSTNSSTTPSIFGGSAFGTQQK